jgi:N-acetylmuramoyl-L-alanine amidase/putative methionine-R-sulfoxide reductase with GAF domain
MLLVAHGPAHFAMPATAQHQNRSPSHSCCDQTEGNLPAGLLFFSHQNPTTIARKTANYADSSSVIGFQSTKSRTEGGPRTKEKYCDCAKTLVTYNLRIPSDIWLGPLGECAGDKPRPQKGAVSQAMSATSSNAGAGWVNPHTNNLSPTSERNGEGQNALQALLAFACIHEQAAKRRRTQSDSHQANESQLIPKEELFALDEVLHLVSERALSITGADGVAIALAEDNAIVCRASFGSIAPDPGTKLDGNSGFSGACLRSGQTVRCDDTETDARVNAEICRRLGARSMIAVPLAAKQRVVGLLEAFSTEPNGFNDSDVRSLNLLGELILAAVRPEEEDRLAEIAARVVVPAPAVPPPIPSAPLEVLPATASAPVTAEPAETPPSSVTAAVPSRGRIIVDEKFAPLPAPKEKIKPVRLSEAEVSPAEFGAKQEPKQATITESDVSPDTAAPNFEPVQDRGPLVGVGMIAALVLVAIGLGWTVWMKIRHAEQVISANTQPVVEVKTGDDETRELILPAPAEVKPGPEPKVTGLRQWSSGDSSTVVVELQDQVQYEAHSLDNPARIYFDLHDTQIAPELTNRSIDVNAQVLKRVRMAQPVDGVTRVVLDTTEQAEFSVSLDPNPYRLTIEVHKASAATAAMATAAKATPATLPKTLLPKPSPVIPSPRSNENKQITAKDLQIVLDAGHGGWDRGTVGKKGLLEKDLVLDIVQRLGKLLETKMGAQIIYTRDDDSYVPLEKRAEIANLAAADLFLSVHANYSDLSTARGVETYYTNTYSSVKARTADDASALKQVNWTGVDIRAKVTDSHKLASDIQQALCGSLVATNPDLRNRGVKEAQYVVLTGTQMPAVLAEVSFVSSPEDETHLQSSEYRQQIAQALYRGVAKYREEIKSKNTKLASAKKPDPKKD